MYTRCPKCGHRPLPVDQALPAACPACGVILAKFRAATRRPLRADGRRVITPAPHTATRSDAAGALAEHLFRVPDRVDSTRFWLRVALLAGFTAWGVWLTALDHRTGAIGQSFIHGPLLVFHEAGHVLFMPFGEWLTVFGGTLAQLLMPAIVCAAFLLKNRDPFGAAIGLWLLGVSLLDMAPYVYDALHPQLMLLTGAVGEAGGHDWIHLLASMGLLRRAQLIGSAVHKLGALVVLLALAWAARLLWLQRERRVGDVLTEE